MDEAYATIADLRAEGVDEASVPDGRALDLLKLASRTIDRMTGQWFFPRRIAERRNGDGSAFLHLPSLIPILEVERIRIGDESLVPDAFAVRERYVERIGARFPTGVANVELAGVFGWLERRAPFVTVLVEPLAPGATEAKVADPSGLRAGDAVLIDGRVSVLLSDVVRFDPAEDGAPAGARVVAYGRVPRPVRRACLMIAARNRHGLATAAAVQQAIADRVVEERTDNYMYRLATWGESERPPEARGDLDVEQLLADFVAPPFVGVV